MRLRWDQPLFIHLALPRDALLRSVPSGLTLEGAGDDATVSLVAIHVTGPAPIGLVARLLRATQLNVRTYVQGPHGPGIAFLDIQVDSFWPLAARALGLPYRRTSKLAYDADSSAVALRAKGIAVKGLPAPDAARELDSDHPARAWLDRRVAYAALPGGLRYALSAEHEAWRVRDVQIDPDSRIELPGLPAGRVLSAQLAESLDASIMPILPSLRQRLSAPARNGAAPARSGAGAPR